MNERKGVIIPSVLVFILAGLVVSVAAQEVSIPDPGLNAAIRDTLPKPVGPLTQGDLLRLTNLSARSRNVQSIVSLEAAQNLFALDLQGNHLTDFPLPNTLTKLEFLNLILRGVTSELRGSRVGASDGGVSSDCYYFDTTLRGGETLTHETPCRSGAPTKS